MKKLINISIAVIVAIGTLAAISLSQPDPEELIIGEWNGVKPNGINWKFTDSKLIKNNDLEYSYTLTKGATTSQCKGPSYDAVYNSDQLVLIQIHEKLKKCYMIDALTETRLVLFSESSGQYFSFKKQ